MHTYLCLCLCVCIHMYTYIYEKTTCAHTLQQVAWHNQSKAGAELIIDISNVRRHLPEVFSRCSPTVYSPSIIIELAELLYIQPAPADPVDSSRVATNLRQILRYLGPPAASCNFINTMRKGSPSYSIVMAFDDAFRTWEGKLMHICIRTYIHTHTNVYI